MKVLVTGGAGFIGSHTVDALVERGDKVVILDNLSKPVHLKGKPEYLNPEAEFIEGDVRDADIVSKLLNRVDAVVHLAAYQDYLPDFSTFFSVNAVGTSLIYETIVREKLELHRVVVATSQAVSGEGLYECPAHGLQLPHSRPAEQLTAGDWQVHCPICATPMAWQWTPESVAIPENQYALSKHAQEQITLTFGRRYGIPSTAMRYSIVQGPRQSFYNAYSGACRIFALHYFFGKAPMIYEDGQMKRDFVNIKDVVRANLLALDDESMIGGHFNVGGGKAFTIAEFDRTVAKEFGREDLRPAMPGAYRFGDTRNACSDISKLRSHGWEPQHTPAESVHEYANYLRAQDNVDEILEYSESHMRSLGVVRQAV